MADARLSDLPVAGSLGDSDLAAVVQGTGATAETRRATMVQLRSAMQAERDLHVRDFGAVGNGTSDDVVAIQAAIDAAAAAGGGIVRLGAKRYLIAAADLNVKPYVTLAGGSVGGQREAANYTAAPFALIVDPARTIRMRRGSRLEGLAVLRRGLTAPTTLRGALTAIAAFAGTAVTVGDGTGTAGGDGADTRIERLLIVGFDRAIASDYSNRLQIRDVLGDNRNGVSIGHAYDIVRVHGVHFWPFVTGNLSNISLVSRSITGVANNGGGLIRVTTAVAHDLATGDLVNLTAVGGVPNANGRFTVTVVSTTVVDLQGSSFAGAYTSGGLLHIWSNRRTGRAFQVSNSDVGDFVDCFAYGYDVGFEFGTGAQAPQLVNCSVDNNAAVIDPVPVGLLITGNAFRTKWVGGFLSSQGTTVRVQSSSIDHHHMLGCVVNGGNVRTLDVVSGGLTLEGCDITSGPSITGSGTVCVLNIQDAAQNLTLIGNDMRPATFTAQSDAALQKIVTIGNRTSSLAARVGGGSVEFMTVPSAAAGLTRRMDIAADGAVTVRRRGTTLGARLNFANAADDAVSVISLGSDNTLAIGGDPTLNPNGGLDLGASGGATAPYTMRLRRISATPVNGDRLAQVQFNGLNSSAAEVTYARLSAYSDTVTTGAEAGSVSFETRQGASLTERFRISASGTLTLGGPLVLAADPAAAMQATTKQYVDGQFTERRLAAIAVATATAITYAAHNSRMLVANAGASLSVDWTATGDGFSCLIVNRTAADLGFTLTGFTSNTAPSNGDGLTKVKAGGIASLFCFSPDGGTTKLCHLAGSAAA